MCRLKAVDLLAKFFCFVFLGGVGDLLRSETIALSLDNYVITIISECHMRGRGGLFQRDWSERGKRNDAEPVVLVCVCARSAIQTKRSWLNLVTPPRLPLSSVHLWWHKTCRRTHTLLPALPFVEGGRGWEGNREGGGWINNVMNMW